MVDRFDVIVVGAGPGGSSTALSLARKGYNVLVLEKGKVPGHRNVTGGTLFGTYQDRYGLVNLIPDFENEAPIERKITDHLTYLLDKPKEKQGEYSYKFSVITKDSFPSKVGLIHSPKATGKDYSVLRVKFDKWLASKAAEAGAMIATEATVDDLIFKDDAVIGVRVFDEELYSDVVIDASGVTSQLIQRAGLRKKLEPEDVYHGVKHVYSLDSKAIEERFGVQEGEGKDIVCLGEFMEGVNGGAFLYPNKDTISVGVVASLDSIVEQTTKNPHKIGKPLDLLENFERHPMISEILEGAVMEEYSSHNIPKGPKCMLNPSYINGFMAVGDSLGAFVKIGPMIDGIRRAIATGMMASETYIYAKRTENFTGNTLSKYTELLSPIYSDIGKAGRDSRIFENSISYNLLPKMIFSLNIMVETRKVKGELKSIDDRDAIQKIQERTGLLDYDEDENYSHIDVNYDVANKSKSKPWVSACPFNCYTLVLDKGVFASFKDLYNFNVNSIKKNGENITNNCIRDATLKTKEDIENGKVRFDHVACVGCGTCGQIGPIDAVSFGHERLGHGVKYKRG